MANIVSGFRISNALVVRITGLTERLATIDSLTIITKVTRSVVMRMAILEGLKTFEAHYELNADSTAAASGASEGATRGKKPNAPLNKDSEHVSLSLPAWLLDRAQAVAEVMNTDPEMGVEGHASRAYVLRRSLAHGASVVARQYLPESEWPSPFAGIEDVTPHETVSEGESS